MNQTMSETMNEPLIEPVAARRVAGRPNILVVDDATVVRLYCRHVLETEGMHVEEAMNGLEGIEKAVRTAFDLCVVDVNMPIMDGYAFVRALRREPATRGVPVLMSSTEAAPQDRMQALQAGANFYLVKPVPQDRLALHVSAMLCHRRGGTTSVGTEP